MWTDCDRRSDDGSPKLTLMNRGRVEGLDVLRGVAVGLVMLRHAFPGPFGGAGVVGVTVFFALSGYLITGLLTRDLERYGRIRWGRFYAHRAFRLYPALLTLLVVWASVELATNALGSRESVPRSLVLAVTYTSDLPLPWSMGLGVNHLWSLAVEEQFYLVWPLLLFIAWRARARLIRVAVGVAVVLTAACWITLSLAAAPGDIYERPTTWASAMAIGAVAQMSRARLEALKQRMQAVLAVAGAIVLVGLSVLPDVKNLAATYLVGPTLISLATVALILFLGKQQTAATFARPLLWLGTISYAAYLWNLPVTEWIRRAGGDGQPMIMVLALPATVVAATISWWTVEALGRLGRAAFDGRRRLDTVPGSSAPSAP
ncbi:hypothetical protein BH11ACT2_BH11ACT2_17160 [soil metagenome]